MTYIIWQYHFTGTQSPQSPKAPWLNVTIPLTEHQVFKGRIEQVYALWERSFLKTSTKNDLEKNRLLNDLISFHFWLKRPYTKNQYVDY